MAKEYIEREAVKRELLSWAVSLNHPEYLIKDDALHIIDSFPAADVVEQEQESKLLNGWISVQDRLPENGVHVLICCEMRRYGGEIAGKYVCDGYYAEANKIIAGDFPDECNYEYSEEDDEFYLREGWYEVVKNWDDFNSVAVEDFVTHWMPLPEPPKEA